MTTTEQEQEASAAIAAWRHAPMDDRPLATRVNRGRRRFRGGLLTVSLGGGVLVGLLLIALTHPHHRQRPDPPTWAEVVGVIGFVLSALLVVGALLWAWRHGRLRDNNRSPLWALTWRERNRAIEQIGGRAPYTAEQVPLLRLLATGSLRNVWYWWLYGAIAGTQFAQVFLHWNAVSPPSEHALAGACFAAVPLLLTRQAAAARRFLQQDGAGVP